MPVSGWPACWIEEAHVSELTGPLREGPAGDHLKAWPEAIRVFARRERPHPGAQLPLFETADGWRYSLWVTNLPAETRGWQGQCAYADAAHRVLGGRRRTLKIAANWPWTDDIITAWQRVHAIPHPI